MVAKNNTTSNNSNLRPTIQINTDNSSSNQVIEMNPSTPLKNKPTPPPPRTPSSLLTGSGGSGNNNNNVVVNTTTNNNSSSPSILGGSPSNLTIGNNSYQGSLNDTHHLNHSGSNSINPSGSDQSRTGGEGSINTNGGGSKGSDREPPSLGSIQNIHPTTTTATTTTVASGGNKTKGVTTVNSPKTLIPKNPKDTAAYVISPSSPAGMVSISGGSGIVGGGSGSGSSIGNTNNNGKKSSPKRRLVKAQLQQHQQQHASSSNSLDFGPTFGSVGGGETFNNNNNNNRGVSYNNNMGTNRSLSGSIGGTVQSLGKSVKSVPTTNNNNAYIAAGGGGGGGMVVRGGTTSSSGAQLMSPHTPGSVASLHSMKDIHILHHHHNSSSTSVGGTNNNSMLSNNNNVTTAIAAAPTNNNNNNPQQQQTSTSLDDEEQYMFEQRLTQDELGVAIRKISSSGKAQLRYVKCVTLRPPSSSDFDIVHDKDHGPPLTLGNMSSHGLVTSASSLGNNIPRSNSLTVPYLEKKKNNNIPSDSISVSSKSSTGSRFLERMRNTSSGVMRGTGRVVNHMLPTATMSSSLSLSNNNHNNIVPLSSSTAELRGSGSHGGGTTHRITSLSNNEDDNLLLHSDNDDDIESNKKHTNRALTWGKKNTVTLSLNKFTCVKKGKCTERTIRNSSPSCRLLSIITNVRENESLDIEAPTKLDRDKFASAFAKFLGVPLLEEEEEGVRSGGGGEGGDAVVVDGGVVERAGGRTSVASAAKKKIRTPSLTRSRKKNAAVISAAQSEPGGIAMPPSPSSTPKVRNRSATAESDSLLPKLTPNSDEDADRELAFDHDFGKETIGGSVGMMSARKVSADQDFAAATPAACSSSDYNNSNIMGSMAGGGGESSSCVLGSSSRARAGSHTGDDNTSKHTMETMSESARKRITLDGGSGQGESMLEPRTSTPQPQDTPGTGEAANNTLDDTDNHSHVSSLTGGVDQEIVEELHQAIIELRSELDASRAEAARAVKVAEQAIQSAENCTSSDWNSTVTHKAAEAAAQAQKKSAEAIARARMAEERLAAERKSTSFWRRQAQSAEEEAGSLKTRSAAAEVKQAVMMEELSSERRKAARMFAGLKKEFQEAEKKQGEEMTLIQERKRMLEIELNEVKNEMEKKEREATQKVLEMEERKEKSKGPHRMRPHFRRPSSRSSSSPQPKAKEAAIETLLPANESMREPITTLQTDIITLRKQFELVKHTSMDEILSLHRQSEEWSSQASRAVATSTAETDLLREKLAAESAMRLKLLNELQDIRGTVRVYCRPKPVESGTKNILKIPTHDILVLNEDTAPMSFKYDRVFSPGASQYEVFSELEEPLISSLDGFNVTLMAFGQGESGKTHTLLGDVIMNNEDEETDLPELKSYGVQLQAIQQLFTIAGHRTDRYKDAFSMTMVEVHNEKLFDLLAGTPSGEQDGEVIICETRDSRRDKRREGGAAGWPKGKLEIRTNIDGNTVVQGVVSIPIESFEDAITIWQESIANRSEQLNRQGSSWKKHERRANVITTIHITSVNIATGVGTEGKLQFIDMASSDIVSGAAKVKDDSSVKKNVVEEDDTQFANKSIDAFNDVITARCQFDRSVPYRNSTLTHLLRDSLEADTKVLLMCCVRSEEAHLADTVGALRFASRMQKVSIGKATKHIVGSKEV